MAKSIPDTRYSVSQLESVDPNFDSSRPSVALAPGYVDEMSEGRMATVKIKGMSEPVSVSKSYLRKRGIDEGKNKLFYFISYYTKSGRRKEGLIKAIN